MFSAAKNEICELYLHLNSKKNCPVRIGESYYFSNKFFINLESSINPHFFLTYAYAGFLNYKK